MRGYDFRKFYDERNQIAIVKQGLLKILNDYELNTTEAAKAMDICRSAFYQICNGSMKLTRKRLFNLAYYLKVSPIELEKYFGFEYCTKSGYINTAYLIFNNRRYTHDTCRIYNQTCKQALIFLEGNYNKDWEDYIKDKEMHLRVSGGV